MALGLSRSALSLFSPRTGNSPRGLAEDPPGDSDMLPRHDHHCTYSYKINPSTFVPKHGALNVGLDQPLQAKASEAR